MQLYVSQTYTIAPTGGKAPYTYSVISGAGSLFGAIFKAPPSAGATQIKVLDSLGQSITFSAITVALEQTVPLTINALGTGVSSAYVPNCTPLNGTDFMDGSSWNVRRLEPRDCTFVSLTTPIFSWPLPIDLNGSIPMTLTIKRPSDGFTLSRSTSTPRILLNTILSSGQYEWTVSYTNKNNTIITSQVRHFVVANDPNLMALPTGSAFSTLVVNKSHPRALPAGSDFATIATKAKNGEYKVAFTYLLSQADASLNAVIPAPPANLTRANFNSDLEFSNWNSTLRGQTGTEGSAIEVLAYAGRFTGNSNYDDVAIKHLLALAAWPTTGVTSEETNDQINRIIYLSLAKGLDLLQTKLTAQQRLIIVTTLKDRVAQTMNRFSGLDGWPYDSHLLVCVQYVLNTLMYTAGMPEYPEAQNLLARTWEVFATMQGMWGGDRDAGYANSDSYGWFTMLDVASTAAGVKLIAGIDLTRWPAVGNYLNNQIALTPAAANLRGSFGDGVEETKNYLAYASTGPRLLASVSGRTDYEWYWRANPANITSQIYLEPLHFLLLGIRTPVAPSSTPVLPASYIFEDAGLVAIHSLTTDSLRSSLYFRSSRFGSYNHSHADNNAFTFVSKGKEIFISGGYYDYFYSPHNALTRGSRFKNALTFNGGIGQAEPSTNPTEPGVPVASMEPRGQLINYVENGTWAMATGDAALAYRGMNPTTKIFSPLLSNAIRTVAYNRKERVAVIYDWATSSTARVWELNFHSLQQATLQGSTVHIFNGTTEACMDIYGMNGSYAFTDGFPIMPSVVKPNQYHTRFSASNSSTQLVSVTVIREDCRVVPVNVNLNGTSASVIINNAAAVIFDKKTIKQ